ncbi:uncharacterized protein LOC128966176 [Oppia nitens]|uniref:uncharacterized protein LOC128966176 n=1 Tax=Oppia nitens TaxID=1686743 RepID=UPI0023DCDB70|nr:uncharacterized protein LOC128966176 [Oppia nitens]
MNFWWFFDCQYCWGHECWISVCADYPYHCFDRCYPMDLIDDQEIHNSYHEIYLGSAFLVNRYKTDTITDDNVYEILAKLYIFDNYRQYYLKSIECLFSNTSDNTIFSKNVQKNSIQLKSTAKVIQTGDYIDENDSSRIQCRLNNRISAKYVSIVDKLTDKILGQPIVINNNNNNYQTYSQQHLSADPLVTTTISSSSQSPPAIVVCVRPLFNSYDSIRSLIEFIGYYRSNGADKIAIYVDRASDRVMNLLAEMSSFVDLIHWHTVVDDDSADGDGSGGGSGRHVLGNGTINQVLMSDDCYHRYPSMILIYVDIDEFMVPFGSGHHHRRRQSLREYILDEYFGDPKLAAIGVSNVFFCCEFNQKYLKKFPRIFHHFRRESNVWSNGFRTKFIVLRPNLVDVVYVHSLTLDRQLANDSYFKYADTNDILMFHYRSCCSQMTGRTPLWNGILSVRILTDNTEIDTRIMRFSRDDNNNDDNQQSMDLLFILSIGLLAIILILMCIIWLLCKYCCGNNSGDGQHQQQQQPNKVGGKYRLVGSKKPQQNSQGLSAESSGSDLQSMDGLSAGGSQLGSHQSSWVGPQLRGDSGTKINPMVSGGFDVSDSSQLVNDRTVHSSVPMPMRLIEPDSVGSLSSTGQQQQQQSPPNKRSPTRRQQQQLTSSTSQVAMSSSTGQQQQQQRTNTTSQINPMVSGGFDVSSTPLATSEANKSRSPPKSRSPTKK